MFSWADCIFALLYLFSTQSLCYSITFTKIFWAISGLTSFTLIFTGIYCKQHLNLKYFLLFFCRMTWDTEITLIRNVVNCLTWINIFFEKCYWSSELCWAAIILNIYVYMQIKEITNMLDFNYFYFIFLWALVLHYHGTECFETCSIAMSIFWCTLLSMSLWSPRYIHHAQFLWDKADN